MLKKLLTQQTSSFINNKGRTTDETFWKDLYHTTSASWDSYYGSGSGYGSSYHNDYYGSSKTKRKHEFSSILLITSTVYDCKHCKRKKEDCKYEYCEDEDNPPGSSNDGWDIGGW